MSRKLPTVSKKAASTKKFLKIQVHKHFYGGISRDCDWDVDITGVPEKRENKMLVFYLKPLWLGLLGEKLSEQQNGKIVSEAIRTLKKFSEFFLLLMCSKAQPSVRQKFLQIWLTLFWRRHEEDNYIKYCWCRVFDFSRFLKPTLADLKPQRGPISHHIQRARVSRFQPIFSWLAKETLNFIDKIKAGEFALSKPWLEK